jgi:cell division protein ZapA (FtsZ GTPase activity inhibitor)
MKFRASLFTFLSTLIAFGVMTACNRMHEVQTTSRKISPADLRFDSSSSTSVISSAQKFIIPVPKLDAGGEPLVYPQGHEKAGKPILDYEGKPIGEKGLVFLNAKDQSWQAVAGDGEGVIIVNEVTPEQAARLDQKVRELNQNPDQLTLPQLKQVVAYARNDLKLNDMYNSTRSFIKSKMTPVAVDAARVDGASGEAYGLKKRDDRDLCQAIYIPGKFTFEGPAATPQVFENGGVIVKQGADFRGVQPDIFRRTYRLQNAQQITSLTTDLKTWSP